MIGELECYDNRKYCVKCGAMMVTKNGIFGLFRSCSNYPKCDWTQKFQSSDYLI